MCWAGTVTDQPDAAAAAMSRVWSDAAIYKAWLTGCNVVVAAKEMVGSRGRSANMRLNQAKLGGLSRKLLGV